MKFSFAIAALFGGANAFIASPVEQTSPTLIVRDLATAINVLSDVKAGFEELQKAAAAFNGDPAELKDSAAKVFHMVELGTQQFRTMTPLTVSECLSLAKPVDDLAAQGDLLAKELESCVSDLEKNKQCSTVRDFLANGVTDAQALIDALKAKVPSSVQGIIMRKGHKIIKALQDAQAALIKGKCNVA